jgi:PPIC-type PPIASE domain
MRKFLFSLLLVTGFSYGQTVPSPTNSTKPAPPQGVTVTTSSTASNSAVELPPTAPVITVDGLCPDASTGSNPKSADCKTVVTKAAFEKLIDAINPKMPPPARAAFASEYAKILALSAEAKKRGLEDSQQFRDFISFMRLQVGAQVLIRTMQEQAKPSEADIEKFYNDKKSEYEEISLKRVFIPRNSPTAKPDDKRPTDDDLKAEGEKVRDQLKNGEDFDQVQKAVYTSKGYTTPPPPTTIPNWHRQAMPPSQKALFDLKEGELSQVMVEPAGAYVYKVVEKKTTPLEAVKADIESQMVNNKMKEQMDAITGSVKPELNPAYFQTRGGPDNAIGPAGMPPVRPTPRPVQVVPGKPAPTHPAPPAK